MPGLKIYLTDADTGLAIEGAVAASFKFSDNATVGTAIGPSGVDGIVTIESSAPGWTTVAHYLTVVATGYYPVTKLGEYNDQKVGFVVDPALAETGSMSIKVSLYPVRARTSVVVTTGDGLTLVAPITPLEGVGIDVSIAGVTPYHIVETVYTNADGVALLDDDLYSCGAAGLECRITYPLVEEGETGAGGEGPHPAYTGKTVFISSACPGTVVPVRINQTPFAPTGRIEGRLLDISGLPKNNQAITLKYLNRMHTVEAGEDVYHVLAGTTVTVRTNSEGYFYFDILAGCVVQPQGWAALFGYPDTMIFYIIADSVTTIADAIVAA